MPKKITVSIPPTMWKKFKTSASGYVPGLVANAAAIPNMFGEMASQASKRQADIRNEYLQNSPYEKMMQEKYGDLWDKGNLLNKPFENPFHGRFFPTRQEALTALKDSPIGQMLPEGALDRTGPIESHVDNLGLNMLLGGLGTGAKTLSELGSAMRNAFLPALGAETGSSLAESMKFGEGGQIGGGFLGAGVGALLNLLTGKVMNSIPGSLTNWGKKAVYENIPGSREFGKAFSEEEKAALQQYRIAQKEEVSKAKALEKQSKENQKLIEKFGRSDVGVRQEERGYLEREQKAAQTKLSEAEALKEDLRKFNEEAQIEKSKMDAQGQKRRDKLSNDIDKFQAENDNLMSKEDARALKEKIANGENVDLEDTLNKHSEKLQNDITNISNDIQDIGTFEDLIAEKFGMKPKQLKEKISGHFKRFKESTPVGAEVSAHELEAVHKYIENEFLGGHELDVPSHNTVRKLISNNRKMIKNGKISVRDVADILKNTNEVLKDVKLTRGDLLNAEKLVSKPLAEAVDKTMNMAKKAYPDIKLNDWYQGRKLTRNLYSTQEAVTWVNDQASKGSLPYLNRFLKQPISAFAQNPEVRKYWVKATGDFMVGNTKTAIKNLVAANKLASRSYKEEPRVNPIKPISTPLKQGMFRKITPIK